MKVNYNPYLISEGDDMDENKNRLRVDAIRLCNLLDQNLLVQANAVVQRLESVLEEELKKSDPKQLEQNPLFSPFTLIHSTRSFILSGKTVDARQKAEAFKIEIFRS